MEILNSVDIPMVWAGLIALAVFVYVLLDGFDLGCGILLPFTPSEKCKNRMINSIAPFWDGNETWLVLGGGGLFAVFPLAYSVIMSAFYLPIIFMLIGLILRGVAFEFRYKTEGNEKALWDKVFFAGSLIASFFQGVILGGIIQGIEVENNQFAGDPMFWLTGFSILTGISVIIGYALIGATWTIMKTTDLTQEWARSVVNKITFPLMFVVFILGMYYMSGDERVFNLWFNDYLAIGLLFGLSIAFCVYKIFTNTKYEAEYYPFIYTILLFLIVFLSIVISLYPWIVPYELTFYDAASHPKSQGILLIGAVFLLPIIIMYTIYSYYIFKGKTDDNAEY